MNTNHLHNTSRKHPVTNFCIACGKKLMAEIQRTKQELTAQFRKTFRGNERMLRLVLNEAEALAFLTDYPLLVFPTLALEKVQGAVAWQRHQVQVRAA